ncbi:MAG TPA: bifunctional serine/threonine-protein kinase/formylglycine-generating enzyme family protein [Gemmataceae bacterium]|nr:bifunctional serine/threonine-protein kinase/formylglycine-generating enzyme family protein [Gemmataceae bacterium]
MAEQPDRARAVFDRARTIASPAERRAYLDQACAGDAPLRRQVELLLWDQDADGDLLSGPVPERPTVLVQPRPAPEPDDSEGRTAIEALPAAAGLNFLQPSDKPDSLGRIGHYEMREVLGRGAFGVVFKAFDEKLRRVVAVKVLGPQLAGDEIARKCFLREARSAAAVRNEHVVSVYAVEELPIPYLVMEYVAGRTLQEKLSAGPLELPAVLRIGSQIADGLAAAHRQGLIHRDIKPPNILLENGVERVKVADFGLARATDGSSLTQPGLVAGTPMYMAPEQAKGEVVDSRADLFSLGSVLYALCTGQPPFHASTPLGVLQKVCETKPQPIRELNPHIPEWLCAIIDRLQAKKPADRGPSAEQTADLLSAGLAELQGGSPRQPETPREAISPPVRRMRFLGPAVVGVVLLLLLAAGLGLTEATGVTHLTGAWFRALPPGPTPSSNDDSTAAVPAPAAVPFPFSAEQAKALQEGWAKHLGVDVETKNSVQMPLRLIPPGEFAMTPNYQVRLSKPFRLGRCEVTVGQFRAFVQDAGYMTDMEKNPYGRVKLQDGSFEHKPAYNWRHPDVSAGDDYPVGQVSWHDAVEFCKWLSRKEHRTYRLPTDAEWDWAARSGSGAAYSYGDDPSVLGDYAWIDRNSGWKSHPVGLKKPNAWGLFDTYGNVCEYCQDWATDGLRPPEGAVTDPQGPLVGNLRLTRGGGFVDGEGGLSSQRGSFTPTLSMSHFGFRVLCEVPEAK